MVQSSASAPSLHVGSRQAGTLLHSIAQFLIRRRIVLSGLLFIAPIAADVLTGVKPHDLIDYRDPTSIFGLALVLSGLAIRSWSAGVLRKDRELTTTGPYRLIRNPLYVGSFLMMFGFCELIGDPKNIFYILGPVLLMYLIKVRGEEQLLSERFAAEWRQYARSTPRFIPRTVRLDLTAAWSAEQWMRSREYQALATTLAALVAIKIWQVI
jgi:protein-S-isoprenylcysteine O-methyltransferase Ste14